MAMSRSLGATPLTTRSPILISPELTLSSPAIKASKRRLSATRRPDQHHEFARLHLKVDALQHGDGAEGFVEVANRQRGHIHLLLDGSLRQSAQKIPAAEEIDEKRRQSGHQHGGAFDAILVHRLAPGAERDQSSRDRLVGA